MRKRWIVIFIMLWVLAGIQVFKNNLAEREQQMTEVFAQIGTEEKNSETEYFGKMKGSFMDEEERKQFLVKTAGQLGITEMGNVIEEQREGHILTQITAENTRSRTELKILTMSSKEQYLCVRISFENDLYSAMYYRTRLSDLLEEKVEHPQNTMTAYGFYRGNLTVEEKDKITEEILDCFGAHTVSRQETEQLYTTYGYTGGIKDYIMLGDQAVNLNIAMTYNEIKDKTKVYVAIPVMSESY
ncbi:MAG: YwmB family TATA-box binding protein [Eubacteriales bacterium]|nr:YwmB family TATA-box binding protein [Eubacteriales bacterium]